LYLSKRHIGIFVANGEPLSCAHQLASNRRFRLVRRRFAQSNCYAILAAMVMHLLTAQMFARRGGDDEAVV